MSDQVNKLLHEIGYDLNIQQRLSIVDGEIGKWIDERWSDLREALAKMGACAQEGRSLEYMSSKLPEIIAEIAWVKTDLESIQRSIYNEMRRRDELAKAYDELKSKTWNLESCNDTI